MELVKSEIDVRQAKRLTLEMIDQQIIQAVQAGLPLVSEPYKAIADQIGIDEDTVLERLQSLQDSGVFKRFGVVVRHKELGYRANAMVVWNISDEQLQDFASSLLQFPFVTLCYSRPRRLPDWPYSLFCMIHGKHRDAVLQNLSEMRKQLKIEHVEHRVLFSKRRFKQRGARYFSQKNDTRHTAEIMNQRGSNGAD